MSTALDSVAFRLGVPVGPQESSVIARFFALMLRWNERVNLTGARTDAELVGEHLCDSLAMARLVPGEARTLVDVGSGGGLPAIPFAVLRPAIQVTLVESRAKRAAFLRAAVRELGIPGVEVFGGRLEDFSREGFDVASSRAMLSPPAWLDASRRLVGASGRSLVFAAGVPAETMSSGVSVGESLTYQTEAGHSRWAGAYCFT